MTKKSWFLFLIILFCSIIFAFTSRRESNQNGFAPSTRNPQAGVWLCRYEQRQFTPLEDAVPETIVKVCPCCSANFTAIELAQDPAIQVIGMSFIEDSIEEAYYFFQHETTECGSSFMVSVDAFESLIPEPIPCAKLALRACCEEHCVSVKDLAECKNECHFAPYRRFMLQMMKQKGASPTKPLRRLVPTRQC